MRLEFKFDRLAIKDMNKLLYDDFTCFASTPRDRSKNSKSPIGKPPTRGYKPYFKNQMNGNKLANLPEINKSQGKLRLKTNLNLNKADDSNGTVLTQLQKLLYM